MRIHRYPPFEDDIQRVGNAEASSGAIERCQASRGNL